MSDYYQTLGVAKNATPDDIKKAYRRMAGIHHPDKGGDTAQFQKIQEAYETLSNPEKKQQYDNPNPFGGGGPQFHNMGGFPGGFQFNMNGFDMHDIFGQMFGHHQRPQMPSYRTTVHVHLDQAYTGGEQILQFHTVQGQQMIKINIPKGVQDGSTIRYDNLIRDGILLVEFRIHPHPRFERDGHNLYSVHDISVLDLIVGSKFKFNTISGKSLEVTVPPKTQPGSKLRLSKEGMPINNDYGDQFILLKPFIPDMIDSAITDSILQSKNK
jgi:DnaJ-class molecular chaperone